MDLEQVEQIGEQSHQILLHRAAHVRDVGRRHVEHRVWQVLLREVAHQQHIVNGILCEHKRRVFSRCFGGFSDRLLFGLPPRWADD